MAERKLTRIPAEGTIAGVCAGLAKYFDIDVSLVRVGFVLATILTSGGFILVYLVLAIVLPAEAGKGPKNAAESTGKSDDQIKVNIEELKKEFGDSESGGKIRNYIGLGLILLGAWLLVGQWFPEIFRILSWEYILPLVLIAAGIYIATRKES